MGRIIGNLAKAAAILIGVPSAGLLAYDISAVRPQLDRVESILAEASDQDASPPLLIRELIDADAGSPYAHATRLTLTRIYPDERSNWRHVRELLWRVLLPIHMRDDQMYGLYATLTYNGSGVGLSDYARREFSRELNELTPREAAKVVAITHSPSTYISSPDRLRRRVDRLLETSGHGP